MPQAVAAPGPENSEEELFLIGDALAARITEIADGRPYLSQDREYLALKEVARDIMDTAAPIEELRALFERTREFIENFQPPQNLVATILSANAPDPKPVKDLLPANFDEFVNRILSEIEEEYIPEGINAAAQTIIMGEMKAGLAAIRAQYRDKVREMVFETLNEEEQEDTSPIHTGQEEDVLNALHILNEQELLRRWPQIAGIILMTRRSIDDYGFRRSKINFKRITEEDMAQESEAIKRLREYMVSGPGNITESPKARRLRLAARVASITPDGSPLLREVPEIEDDEEIPPDILADMKAEDWA